MPNLMKMDELRSILAATIRGIKARRVKPADAKGIYAGTSQLMNSYKLEMEYRKLAGQKMPESDKFLSLPQKSQGNGKR